MKNILLSAVALLIMATTSFGQIKTPAPSPYAKIEQKIGLSNVMIEYSRPGKKGRDLFGSDALVPFGKLWRTGANYATTIEIDHDADISGQALPKGKYAILSEPNADMWKIHFYTFESKSWWSYTEKTPNLTVSVKSENSPLMMETFTIGFNNFTNSGARMELAWGNTIVPIAISFETDKEVMQSIEKVMAGPSNSDYYSAASYFHSEGKDLNQALEWIKKATSVENPRFWHVRKEALILADLGKYKDAIEAAKKSKMLAEKDGNDDYVRMNTKSINEWMKK